MINPVKQQYKILVVDDDPSVNDMFRSLLEFDGHEVQTAYSGEAAIPLLRRNKFDLLITDYSMHGMQGDELAALVKQEWPDLPIIMASGSYSNSCVVGSQALRVDYFLSKPFFMEELREAIACVLAHSAQSPPNDLGTLETSDTDPLKPAASATRLGGHRDL